MHFSCTFRRKSSTTAWWFGWFGAWARWLPRSSSRTGQRHLPEVTVYSPVPKPDSFLFFRPPPHVRTIVPSRNTCFLYFHCSLMLWIAGTSKYSLGTKLWELAKFSVKRHGFKGTEGRRSFISDLSFPFIFIFIFILLWFVCRVFLL